MIAVVLKWVLGRNLRRLFTRILSPLLTSRNGQVVLLIAALWAWHVHDKNVALRQAREGYVLQVELAAREAELTLVRERLAATDEANRALRDKIRAAEDDELRDALELEAFERETEVNSECRVDADLLRQLRAR